MAQSPTTEFAPLFKSVFGFSMEGSDRSTSWLPEFEQLVKFEPGPDRLTIRMSELAEETRTDIVRWMNDKLGWKAGLDLGEQRTYVRLTEEGGQPVAVLDVKTLEQLAVRIAKNPEGNRWHLGSDFKNYMQEVWSAVLQQTATKAFNLDVRKAHENWPDGYGMRFEWFKTGEGTGEYGLCFGLRGGSFSQVPGYRLLADRLEDSLHSAAQLSLKLAGTEQRSAVEAAFGPDGKELPLVRVPYKDYPDQYKLALLMEGAHQMAQAGIQVDLAKPVDDHMRFGTSRSSFAFDLADGAVKSFLNVFKLSESALMHHGKQFGSVRSLPGSVSYGEDGKPEDHPLKDYWIGLKLHFLAPAETTALATLLNSRVARALGHSDFEITTEDNRIRFPYQLVEHLARRKAKLDLTPVLEPSLALCRSRVEQTAGAIDQLTDIFGYPFQTRYFDPADLFRNPGKDRKLQLKLAGDDTTEQSGKTAATLLKTAGVGIVRVLRAAGLRSNDGAVTIPGIHSPDLRDEPRHLEIEFEVRSAEELAALAQRLAPYAPQLRPIMQAAVAAVPIWSAFGESLFGRQYDKKEPYLTMTRLCEGKALDEIEARLGASKSEDAQEEHPAKQSVARYLSALARHQQSPDQQVATIATSELNAIAGLAPVFDRLVKAQAANGLRMQLALPDEGKPGQKVSLDN